MKLADERVRIINGVILRTALDVEVPVCTVADFCLIVGEGNADASVVFIYGNVVIDKGVFEYLLAYMPADNLSR